MNLSVLTLKAHRTPWQAPQGKCPVHAPPSVTFVFVKGDLQLKFLSGGSFQFTGELDAAMYNARANENHPLCDKVTKCLAEGHKRPGLPWLHSTPVPFGFDMRLQCPHP